MITLANLIPTPRHEATQEVNRKGHTQPRGRVSGPWPIKLILQAGVIGPRGVGSVTDRRRTHAIPAILTHMQEGGSLRGAKPLVTVARVVSGPKGAKVQGDLPRRVSSIYEHINAPTLQSIHKPSDREQHPRWTGDVIEQGQHSVLGGGLHDRVKGFVGTGAGKRQCCLHQLRSRAIANKLSSVVAGVVPLIGDQNLIGGLELEGAQDCVDPAGCVGNEDESPHIAANKGSKRLASLV